MTDFLAKFRKEEEEEEEEKVVVEEEEKDKTKYLHSCIEVLYSDKCPLVYLAYHCNIIYINPNVANWKNRGPCSKSYY